ncbi:ABC transporter ATP-binding protein [Saccharopolyspora spinosa]|uniref:Peptide/nickel transport system ATP-binding protein n=1 Tax=Saccharopolyspora spinosa TaxID=60894 RepID=A0A2N3XUI3_SACSN|nr:ATP-binding cassette domain-containing protein [Saccharopolyspora spinosa]PKW14315.1 peptide/nickel transport system ATP-binding protein [Saccharopolyspora spinosa]
MIANVDALRVEAGGRAVLDGVDLTIGEGEAVGLVGPSGCGKTTLALALLGHLHDGATHVSGQAFVDGRPMLPKPPPRVRGHLIGYLGQDPGLGLTPYLRVDAALKLAGAADVSEALDRVGLPGRLARRYPHQLSGGQQQRVALAFALARSPRLLVLDEPTAALDVMARAEVLAELRRLRDNGVALLWISHDHGALGQLVDRTLALRHGRIASAPEPVAGVVRRPSTQDGEPVLTATAISARHGRTQVLRDVDLTVHAGECLAVLGVSGAGKSTLARCLAGLHRPASGTTALAGTTLAGDVRGRSRDERARVQLVPQNPAESLHPRQTVRTALLRPLKVLRKQQHGVDELLAAVGLPAKLADRLPGELSGGQRQRVALARALAARPKVLVCDEITSALDPRARAEVLALLDDLRRERGLAIVFITHDAAVAAAISDRVLVLAEGRVLAHGGTDELLARPDDLPSLLALGRPTAEDPCKI